MIVRWYWRRRLRRFVSAQADGVYESALAELQAGRKRGHWIWFIFPQRQGLGFSQNSQFYGIVSMREAREYLRHPVLGPRLAECVKAVLQHNRPVNEMLGDLDAVKFRSSMALFRIAAVENDDPLWHLFRVAGSAPH